MGKGNKSKQQNQNKDNKRNDRIVKGALRKRKERSKHGDEKWKQSIKAFGDQLAPQGLVIKDVAGDGNCLFRSISDQFEDTPNNHKKYRKDIVGFIEINKDMFAPFVDDDEYETFEEYIQDMKQDGTWGGNVELQACSLIYGVNIVVHQLNQPRWEINNHFFDTKSKQAPRFIQLSYHNEEHYSSVRSINETFFPSQKGQAPTANIQLFEFADNNNGGGKNAPGVAPVKNADGIEDEIFEIIQITGIKSVKLIKEALEDCQYNQEAAIDYLISLSSQIDLSNEGDDEPDNNSSSNGKTTTTTTSSNKKQQEKVSKNPYKGIKKKENEINSSSSNNDNNLHLSNKQRKQLSQKEKDADESKKKVAHNNNHNINRQDIIDDSVIDLGTLNI